MNELPYSSRITYKSDTAFPGIKKASSSRDGDIVDAYNVSGDIYPYLTVRRQRDIIGSFSDLTLAGKFKGKLYYSSLNAFYYDGEKCFDLSEPCRNAVVFGNYLCLYPVNKAIHYVERYYVPDTTEFGGLMEINFAFDGAADICAAVRGQSVYSTLPSSAVGGDIALCKSSDGRYIPYLYDSAAWSVISDKKALENAVVRNYDKYSVEAPDVFSLNSGDRVLLELSGKKHGIFVFVQSGEGFYFSDSGETVNNRTVFKESFIKFEDFKTGIKIRYQSDSDPFVFHMYTCGEDLSEASTEYICVEAYRRLESGKIQYKDIGYNFTAGDTVRISGLGGYEITDQIVSAALNGFEVHSVKKKETKSMYSPAYMLLVNSTGDSFDIDAAPDVTSEYDTYISLDMPVPNLEWAFSLNNRIWGFSGSVIYASALGSPYRFYNYTLLTTSPFSLDTGGEGFTACASYNGYPLFFKSDGIYKLLGDYPSEYYLRQTECAGVKKYAAKSVRQCAGYLFYMSDYGVMRYSGSLPVSISDGISELLPYGCDGTEFVGGAADGKYYISAGARIFVYTQSSGDWHSEDTGGLVWTYTDGADLIFCEKTRLYKERRNVSCAGAPAEKFDSFVEFAPITENTLLRKEYSRLRLRLKVQTGSLDVLISYDGEEFEKVMQINSDFSTNETFCTIRPSRCDSMRIRLEGNGVWTLYGIDRSYKTLTDI